MPGTACSDAVDIVRVPALPEPGMVVVMLKLVAIVLFTHVIPVPVNPGHASEVAVALRLDVPADACHADT